ncbi:uncharacterized protein PRCAT00000333001 [Priceomyces carsonii]|uniref:uncharacterized protein n=1 Tax=Priceomyces carsonii TaxID=28549 RepID=UPI002EDB7C2B|nr:unnamed protein product [Priceomyces carsonii]
MSTLDLSLKKGADFVTFSDNLKVLLTLSVFGIELTIKDDDSELKLKNTKTNFELTEANAIVRYLTKDFESSELIDYVESSLYKALRSDDVKQIIGAIEGVPQITDAKPTAEQIVLFSSVYPVLSNGKSQTKLDEWFEEFLSISLVSEGIKRALSFSPLKRPTQENKGTRKFKSGHLVKKQEESIIPKEGERNILVTSALPYVNNVPHLGNIIGSVLSADVYARYAKNRNYNTIYVCGTDEYGTATETKALEEKVTPRQLCDKYNAIHKQVYDWFDIKFDYFGRTTTTAQTEIAQDIFMKLFRHGYLEEQTNAQLYCEKHNSFLADRFVEGTCPKCHYEDARGDQCDKCGALLDPFELINPRCKLDDSTPIKKNSTHVYLKLNELEPELKAWVDKASVEGSWSKNSRTITNSWIRQGLEPRCITRDLKWGTPVPLEKFKDKVLYVWFDATIGYVSITANYFKDKNPDDWKKWWLNPEQVDLYQFMGKDNVPFHTVVFPASQIGTRDNWTKLYHVSTTEYLQYEGGKFSKSRGIGVFGNNAKDSGIPPSIWRYYLVSIRPETSDAQFSWSEFVTKNNSELLANLGNFVNRIVKFAIAKYNGVIPIFDTKKIPDYEDFESDVNKLLSSYIECMDGVLLRKGLEIAMAISSRGNQFLQENKLDNSLYDTSPDISDAVVAVALNLVYLIGAVICPFMPETRNQICEILNAPPLSITDKFELVLEPGHCIGKAQYLFKRIDEKKIDEWRKLYSGQQK